MPAESITAMAQLIESANIALQDSITPEQEDLYMTDTRAWLKHYCEVAIKHEISVKVLTNFIMSGLTYYYRSQSFFWHYKYLRPITSSVL